MAAGQEEGVMMDDFCLLVKGPSESWVVWAWSEIDDEDGFLRQEQARMIEAGYEARIFAAWK